MSNKKPVVHPSCFVARGAVLIGDVVLEEGVSVWFNAVIRGDRTPIRIMRDANVQDNCVIHSSPGFPATVGPNVTMGHCSLVHGATVEEDSIIGMNAAVLNGAVIGRGSIVAAGAVVKEGTIVPPGSLVAGVPAKILREGDERLAAAARENGKEYQEIRNSHLRGEFQQYP